MKGIAELALEPPLWEVDANLRPEGKDGALVRTPRLAPRVLRALGEELGVPGAAEGASARRRPRAGRARTWPASRPFVWSSASREGFVDSVQRMRERVTANIPADEVDIQLKLGPGGLRDVEFTIQLLQLVHGQADPEVRERSTLGALNALAEQRLHRPRRGGRVRARLPVPAPARAPPAALAPAPHPPHAARRGRPARAGPRHRPRHDRRGARRGLAAHQARRCARLHERLFYRPLLSAVAALPEDGYALTSEQAEARLAAIGFADPRGALHHIAALTGGVSRRAPDPAHAAARHAAVVRRGRRPRLRAARVPAAERRPRRGVLVPADAARLVGRGPPPHARAVQLAVRRHPVRAHPRGGRLARERRGAAAAHRSTSCSRRRRRPSRGTPTIRMPRRSALRTARRREVLRLALAAILGLITVEELGVALSDDHDRRSLTGALALAHRYGDGIEFGIIAMGRYGGAELGFGSDADVMYVYRPAGRRPRGGAAARRAHRARADAAHRGPAAAARPRYRPAPRGQERRDRAVARVVSRRTTSAGRSPGRRRRCCGPAASSATPALLDGVRGARRRASGTRRRSARTRCARSSASRRASSPSGCRRAPTRRGTSSSGAGRSVDVEWFVQLLQLQHAAAEPALRTTSTLRALDAAVAAEPGARRRCRSRCAPRGSSRPARARP